MMPEFATAIPAFIAAIDLSRSTAEAYKKGVESFLAYLRAEKVEKPGRDDLLAFRERLRGSVKPATVSLYLAGIRRFFAWLEDESLYHDIAKTVHGENIDNTAIRTDPLTLEQARTALAKIDRGSARGKRDYAILALLLTTGIREGELVEADLEDIKKIMGETVLMARGKGRSGKGEYVKIAPEVEAAIRDWLREAGERAGDAPLFCSLARKNLYGRLTGRSLRRIVRNALLAAGVKTDRINGHSLRHASGVINLLSGGSYEETQQMLRHGSIETTLIYRKAVNRARNRSERRVAAAIFGGE